MTIHMHKVDYLDEIRRQYKLNPSSLPTALWKYEEWLTSPRLITQYINGKKTFILDHILLYTELDKVDEYDFKFLNLKTIIHSRPLDLKGKWHRKPYFKLFYAFDEGLKQRSSHIPDYNKDNHKESLERNKHVSIRFEEVAPSDFLEVALFINESQGNQHINIEEVVSWTYRSVYDHQLWVWGIDQNTREKVALGIAEFDRRNKEGVLDWIQVKGDFQHHGYGVELVNELLLRLQHKADFVSVAGQADQADRSTAIYEACGFKGLKEWQYYEVIET